MKNIVFVIVIVIEMSYYRCLK